MPRRRALALSWLFVATLVSVHASDAPGTPSADQLYATKLESRVSAIARPLALPDPAAARVHDTLIAYYRELNDWHARHDAELKALGRSSRGADQTKAKAAQSQIQEIHTALQARHDAFLTRLATDLSPAQIEQVKDAMTYRKVEVTYNAYCEIVPNLTEVEKAQILTLLKQAREEAMDGGSAEEKSAVFGRYKGKINNYLSQAGHDVKAAFKAWGEHHSAKAGS